jgi:hypothetical protein
VNSDPIVIASWVTAVATLVLAFFAVSNYCLAKSIKEKSERHEQEIRDFLQASVLAQMLAPHGGESVQSAVARFKHEYKGKTHIFD